MAATLQQALYAFLAADPAIAAAIGNSDGSIRFAPTESALLQPYPRITYLLNNTEDEYTLAANSDQGTLTLTLSIWAKSGTAYSDCWALAALVKDSRGGLSSPAPRLKEFRGLMAGLLYVQSLTLSEEDDSPRSPMDGGEKSIQGVDHTYIAACDFVTVPP
jgi:Protein of unknown function (DUF3168)